MVDRLNLDELGSPDIQLSGLKIWIHGYQFPDYGVSWDADWLNVDVYCETLPRVVNQHPYATESTILCSHGNFLRTDELFDWAIKCAQLRQTLIGKAELECLEPYLSAEISIDERGQTGVSIYILERRSSTAKQG
ncbi:MAG: WapI family immunity protein [Aggregatilineales bacterium]